MLKGKNLYLRTVKEKDLPELYNYLDSTQMKGEYLSSELLSEHQFRLQFFETGFWSEDKGTILLVQDLRIVGAIWFERQAFFDCLNLHFYIFRSEDRGKGLMGEALSLFSFYLFDTRKIERLQISIPDYSKAALRVAQKCGFRFEGIARSALFLRGSYVDLCIYSLLRSERVCPIDLKLA
jgi:ribosomal-protein-alanine N-acetyltransferase